MQMSGWFGRENLSEDERRHALAHELGVPFVDLAQGDIVLEALVIIPEPIAREHNVLAYRTRERDLEVALLNLADLEHLRFLQGTYRVLPRLTTRESMTRGLIRYQRHLRDLFGKGLERHDSPTLLDTLVRHALHSSATDVHVQCGAEGTLVRYRINGLLKNAMTLPAAAGQNVTARLRELAHIPAGTLPREGRFRVDLGAGEDIAVRVHSVPTVGGEKLLLSLSRESLKRGYTLEGLGLHGEGLEAVHRALLKRRGLLSVVGGAGSGKTTFLYTLLDLLNTPEHSVSTVEASVGHTLPRIAQTELASTGLSTAAAVRAALRSDCDVLMVDAPIDSDTAPILKAAAERGVLVLAATESADILPEASLAVEVGLVRKLSLKQFPERHKLTRAQGDAIEESADFARVLATLKEEGRVEKSVAWKDIQFSKPVGSSEHPDGYHGWLGIQGVTENGKHVGLTLAEDALFKAATGQTSIEEVKTCLPAGRKRYK